MRIASVQYQCDRIALLILDLPCLLPAVAMNRARFAVAIWRWHDLAAIANKACWIDPVGPRHQREARELSRGGCMRWSGAQHFMAHPVEPCEAPANQGQNLGVQVAAA